MTKEELRAESIARANAEKALDTLYKGWQEYRQMKGWPCPSKADIEDWESFKKLISKGLERKYEEHAEAT